MMIVKDTQAMKIEWLNKTIKDKFCQWLYQCNLKTLSIYADYAKPKSVVPGLGCLKPD